MIETATFDPHALKNPAVLTNKWLYQKGINYGYANTKAYVLTRDGYRCQQCKGKSKDKRLEVHHIIFRSENGGSDEEDNLMTLCKTCHDALHRGEVTLKKKGKKKGQLNHATQMNSIRIQLLKRTNAEETFGFVTKEHRQLMGLPKEHYFDAVAIATQGKEPTFKASNVLFKKCVSDGDYQQTKGVRSEQVIPTGKLFGFRKFDKVQYKGKEYFIKGRMSSGYAILMDIEGNKVDLKPIPKFSKMTESECQNIMDYHTKNHSKFLLMCHLIFICKYRKKLLIRLGNDVKQLMYDIANRYHFRIVEMEVDKDHIHLLIHYEPKMSILEIARLLKQMTTFHIWKQHEKYLAKHFWKERTFWSDGYFACSIGNVSRETIQKYIQEQG